MDELRTLTAVAAAAAIGALLTWAYHRDPHRRTTTWLCTRCGEAFSRRPDAVQHVRLIHGETDG